MRCFALGLFLGWFFVGCCYCPLWIVMRCPCFACGCSLFFGLMRFLVFCLSGVGFLFNSDSDECPMPSYEAKKRGVKPPFRIGV
jgi:hypothetical protein